MTDVFNDFSVRSSLDFSLPFQQNLVIPLINSVRKGKNSMKYFGTVYGIISQMKQGILRLSVFKSKISLWIPDSCTCRLCKEYIGGAGFIVYCPSSCIDFINDFLHLGFILSDCMFLYERIGARLF